MIEKSAFSNLLLRLGVAFAFLYPPISALYNPDSWLGYLPEFARLSARALGVSDLFFLHAFGVVEVILALWILSGRKIFWPSTTATVLLITIVAFNPFQFEVLFRDLSIAAMSLALAISARQPSARD